MRSKKILFAALIWAMAVVAADAQRSAEKILPLDARIDPEGTWVELSWFDAQPPRVGSVTVKRRLYGQTGGHTWRTLASNLGPVMRYKDTAIKPGVAYEYQVLRSARDIVDVGYWLAGTHVPAQERRGTVHLLIDTTFADALALRLERFERDLVGDGWAVRRVLVPRALPGLSRAKIVQADQVKQTLRSAYQDDPFGRHAVILIGQAPIVNSGRANPDGHDPVPHGSDLFFVELDGQWRASTDGVMLHNQLPSDFIEMQIGRIDFSVMAREDREKELRLLRTYFDKNHHWRHGFLGDLRMAYGGSVHLTVDRTALRNVVGPAAMREGGHHDIGEERPWLLGVDFGDYNGASYPEKYRNRAVFAVNFGSGKQRFNHYFNAMVALLAQPWYTQAVGWGGRPSWWLHHMALGGSIGDVHMRTVNNGRAGQPYRESMDYFPTGDYHWRNPVWVNLMGDPTLRGFPLAPPEGLVTRQDDRQTVVSWQASRDRDVTGYKVYRAPPGSHDFAPLTSEPIAETTFVDTAPQAGARYMVRAYGLKTVYAGSFYTFSQGIFSSETSLPEVPQDITLSTRAGEPVALPDVFVTKGTGPIYAPLKDPSAGILTRDGDTWVYRPPAGFTGTASLDFSVSNAWHTERRMLPVYVVE